MKKKSVYESALRYEINNNESLLKIAIALNLGELCRWDKALDWLESKDRTEEDIKNLLSKIGYNV
jgi:hypothetical protein